MGFLDFGSARKQAAKPAIERCNEHKTRSAWKWVIRDLHLLKKLSDPVLSLLPTAPAATLFWDINKSCTLCSACKKNACTKGAGGRRTLRQRRQPNGKLE